MTKLCTSILLLLMFSTNLNAQEIEQVEDSTWKSNYRAFATKENDLNHTKLVANFDYAKSQLNGEVWLDLHPHFYPTNTLTLDAKAMAIHEIAIVVNGMNKKLNYLNSKILIYLILP